MSSRRITFLTVAAAAAGALSASLSGCGSANSTANPISAGTTIEMIAASATEAASDQLPLVQGVIVGTPDALILSPAAPGAPLAGKGTVALLSAPGTGAVANLFN